MDSLRIAERAVTQNIFQPKQALYRNLPVLFGKGKQINKQTMPWGL